MVRHDEQLQNGTPHQAAAATLRYLSVERRGSTLSSCGSYLRGVEGDNQGQGATVPGAVSVGEAAGGGGDSE